MNLSVVFDIYFGGFDIYKDKNLKELYCRLLNIVLRIIYDVWFYCFCEKFSGCKQNRWGEKKYCPICGTQIEFSNIEERTDYAQLDFEELTKISNQFFSISGRMLGS